MTTNGGHTKFANMYSAYEDFSSQQKIADSARDSTQVRLSTHMAKSRRDYVGQPLYDALG